MARTALLETDRRAAGGGGAGGAAWPARSNAADRPQRPPATTRDPRRGWPERGASFYRELHRAAGGGTDREVLDALWDLVWAGEVTNDTFAPLRALRWRRSRARSATAAGPTDIAWSPRRRRVAGHSSRPTTEDEEACAAVAEKNGATVPSALDPSRPRLSGGDRAPSRVVDRAARAARRPDTGGSRRGQAFDGRVSGGLSGAASARGGRSNPARLLRRWSGRGSVRPAGCGRSTAGTPRTRSGECDRRSPRGDRSGKSVRRGPARRGPDAARTIGGCPSAGRRVRRRSSNGVAVAVSSTVAERRSRPCRASMTRRSRPEGSGPWQRWSPMVGSANSSSAESMACRSRSHAGASGCSAAGSHARLPGPVLRNGAIGSRPEHGPGSATHGPGAAAGIGRRGRRRRGRRASKSGRIRERAVGPANRPAPRAELAAGASAPVQSGTTSRCLRGTPSSGRRPACVRTSSAAYVGCRGACPTDLACEPIGSIGSTIDHRRRDRGQAPVDPLRFGARAAQPSRHARQLAPVRARGALAASAEPGAARPRSAGCRGGLLRRAGSRAAAEVRAGADRRHGRPGEALGPGPLGRDVRSGAEAIRLPGGSRATRARGRSRRRCSIRQVMAGAGNVFKSEILFIERVDPFAQVSSLDRGTLARLVATARRLLVANRTTVRRTTTEDARAAAGSPLWVYGRAGRPGMPQAAGRSSNRSPTAGWRAGPTGARPVSRRSQPFAAPRNRDRRNRPRRDRAVSAGRRPERTGTRLTGEVGRRFGCPSNT